MDVSPKMVFSVATALIPLLQNDDANRALALGKNPLIGFMTWEGYNYEDAVLLSEKLVQDDVYTSVHIEEYEAEARDTKLVTRENGDELSPGVNQSVRIYIAQKRKISVVIKWPVVTVTRVLFPVYFLLKICRSCLTDVRWISF